MIGALSDWLRHLVMIILLAAFLDLILPTTSMQKYVRTVLGLIVMLTMLNPITALIQTHFNLNALETRITGPLFGSSMPWQTSSNANKSSGNVTFQTDLSATLREEVQSGLGVSLQSVQVGTRSSADGTPVVTGVTASLGILPSSEKRSVVIQEVQAQIAESLGLPLSTVQVN